MTDDDKQNLIESYYKGKLSEKERLIFDDLMSNDNDFPKDVKIYSIIYEGFSVLEYESISQQVQQWERKYQNQAVEENSLSYASKTEQVYSVTYKSYLLRILTLAAAICGIAVLTYFFFFRTGKDLYVQFFDVPELYLKVRGEESQNDKNRTEALTLYLEKKYERAIAQLSNYVKVNPEDREALFYLAVSKMNVNRYDSAIADLKEIIKQKGNAYQESAEWMLVLSYYKTGDKVQLEYYLNLIFNNNSHFYYNKALKFKAQKDG